MKTTNEADIFRDEISYELPSNTPARYFANSRFLFTAFKCAVTERQTEGGSFVYTAVNLESGNSALLCRRKNQLDESDFANLAAKVNTLPFRGTGRFTVSARPGESRRVAELSKTLHHIFTGVLPQYGYAVRDKQIELAEHILSVTGERAITLAESEVGTGKTHAYLIAAAIAKRGRINDFWYQGRNPRQSWKDAVHMPVVISTSSIALQNAIVKDYIPELSKILMRHNIINTPLTAVIRKGREALKANTLSRELTDLLIDKILVFTDGRLEICWKLAAFDTEFEYMENYDYAG